MVDFETWRRSVNGVLRRSTIDHVYTNDVTDIQDLQPVETIIGDHSMLLMSLRNEKKISPTVSHRRDWSKYSKEKLIVELSQEDWNWEIAEVQDHWNKIEETLVRTIDRLAPIT